MRAKDRYGNVDSTPATCTFTVDLTPPTLVILSPRMGDVVGGEVTISGVAFDNSASPDLKEFVLEYSGADSVAWTPVGEPQMEPVENGVLGIWFAADLPEGSYVLRLSARDRLGHTSEHTIDIMLDNTPPIASITSPEQDARLSGRIGIAGTAQDAHFKSYRLEYGPGVDPDSSQITRLGAVQAEPVEDGVLGVWEMPKAAGLYTLILRVEDAAGLETIVERLVEVDLVPPTARITGPKDGRTVLWDPEETVTFSGIAYDGDEQGASIDSLIWISSLDGVLHTGTSAEEVNIPTPIPVRGLSMGEHKITLQVWDNEGDSSRAMVSLTVLGRRPVASIDSVYVNGLPVRTVIVREGLDRMLLFGSDRDEDEFGDSVTERYWIFRSEADGYGMEQTLGDSLQLDISAERLGLGRHRIYYRVADNEGDQSRPDSVQVIVRGRFGRAIIVAGGDLELLQRYSAGAANTVYQTLISRRRFEPEDVVYLNPLTGWAQWWKDVHVTDGDVSVARLKREIEAARKDNVELQVPLLIFLAGHGGEGIFQLSEGEILKADDLKAWLDDLAERKVSYRNLQSVEEIPPDEVVLVVDFCFSQTFLERVSGPGRVVIGSSSQEVASVLEGRSFAEAFFKWVSHGGEEANLWRCFEEARTQVASVFRQAPFIDVDGDGISLLDEGGNIISGQEDGVDLAQRMFIGGEIGGQALTLGVESEVYSTSVAELGNSRYAFEVEATPGLAGLSLSFAVLSEAGELPEPGRSGTGILERLADGRGDTVVYRGEHRFEASGEYTVLILGQDDLGKFAGQRQVRVEVGRGIAGDFDGNGEVGFSDFLLFAKGFGKQQGEEGWDARFDLNGDGSVGFPDFLTFARNFGKSAKRVARPAVGFR